MKESESRWPSGIKRTKQRESVLTVLENAEKPLSVAEIYSRIEKSGEAAWLSTVYRILELFVREGIAVKAGVMNHEMAVYELKRSNHKHYAICMNCHKMIPMDHCPMDQFVPELEEAGFHMTGHNLEVYGFCKDCKPQK